jgi:hypothetical protein
MFYKTGETAVIYKYDDMNFFWVSSFYDVPLNGLCKIDGKLHVFTIYCDNDLDTAYEVYSLTSKEKINWLIRKWAFELCVGTHMTYPNKRHSYSMRRPHWFWKLLLNLYYGKWVVK